MMHAVVCKPSGHGHSPGLHRNNQAEHAPAPSTQSLQMQPHQQQLQTHRVNQTQPPLVIAHVLHTIPGATHLLMRSMHRSTRRRLPAAAAGLP